MPNETIITINRKFSRPSAELLKPFSEVPTGYVVDVQNRRGALDCSIKPMFDFPSIAGPAVTVQTVPDDNLAPYLAMDVLKAGDVNARPTQQHGVHHATDQVVNPKPE